MERISTITAATLGLTALWTASATALTPAQKCEIAKLGASGKYGLCRMLAEAKAVKTGDPLDYSHCDEVYAAKWARAETRGAGSCPSSGDEATVQSFVTLHTDDLATALAGGALANCPADLGTCSSNLSACSGDLGSCSTGLTTCTGELAASGAALTTCNADLASTAATLTTCNAAVTSCGADLATCNAEPKGQRVRTGQVLCTDAGGSALPCAGTGQDGDTLTGLARQYTDNGDGTVSDVGTGLMWEKLGDDGLIHDKDDLYGWTTAVAVKVTALNLAAFAGHSDWRLPNLQELQSLVNYGALGPSVDPAFNSGCTAGCAATACSCTQSNYYWSSTSYHSAPVFAWAVVFNDGGVYPNGKTSNAYVRAVRGP